MALRLDRRDHAEAILDRLGGVEAKILAVAGADQLHALRQSAGHACGQRHRGQPEQVGDQREAHALAHAERLFPIRDIVADRERLRRRDRPEQQPRAPGPLRPRPRAATPLHVRLEVAAERRLGRRPGRELDEAPGLVADQLQHGGSGAAQLGVGEAPPGGGGLADQRRLALLDVVPGVGERVGGPADALGDPLIDAEAARIGGEGDARQFAAGSVERRGRQARVARVGRGEDCEGEPQIGDMARHRACDGEEIAARRRIGHALARRHRDAAVAGLERGGAAALRGVAQRAAVVVAEPQRRHAAGEGGRLAAAGAAGRAVGVPGVERRAPEAALAVPAHAEIRHVGAAGHDRARRAQPLDRRSVALRVRLCEAGDAVRGRGPGDLDVLLDGAGHAVERPERLAARERLVGAAGGSERLLGEHDGDGVEARVDRLDACEVRLDGLARRDVARADRRGELRGARAPEIGRQRHGARATGRLTTLRGLAVVLLIGAQQRGGPLGAEERQ